jgi:hypothetical protein
MPEQFQAAPSRLRVMQIIAGALCAGALTFGLVAVIVVANGFERSETNPIVSLVGLGGAAFNWVLHFVIPPKVARVSPNDSQPNLETLYGVYLTRMIIGLALLEGAIFFNVVAYIIEQNWWSLAVASGLLFWMLIKFPTHTRVEHWIETQLAFQTR